MPSSPRPPLAPPAPKAKPKSTSKAIDYIVPSDSRKRRRDDPPETIKQFVKAANPGLKLRKVDDSEDDYSEHVSREVPYDVLEQMKQFEPPPIGDAKTIYDALMQYNPYPALDAFLPLYVGTFWGSLPAAERQTGCDHTREWWLTPRTFEENEMLRKNPYLYFTEIRNKHPEKSLFVDIALTIHSCVATEVDCEREEWACRME